MFGAPTERLRRSVLSSALVVMVAVTPLIAASGQRARSAAITHQVIMDATAFTPATVHANVGDRVTWANRDPFPHTATSREAGFDSKEIAPGKSWTYTVTRKGRFAYLCTLHPTMKGTLIVE